MSGSPTKDPSKSPTVLSSPFPSQNPSDQSTESPTLLPSEASEAPTSHLAETTWHVTEEPTLAPLIAPTKKDKKKNKNESTLIAISTSLLGGVLCVLGCLLCWKKRKKKKETLTWEDAEGEWNEEGDNISNDIRVELAPQMALPTTSGRESTLNTRLYYNNELAKNMSTRFDSEKIGEGIEGYYD